MFRLLKAVVNSVLPCVHIWHAAHSFNLMIRQCLQIMSRSSSKSSTVYEGLIIFSWLHLMVGTTDHVTSSSTKCMSCIKPADELFFPKLAEHPRLVVGILKTKLLMEVLSTLEFCSVTLIPFFKITLVLPDPFF